MKIQNACLSVLLALTLPTAVVRGAEIFNFSDANGASIQFNGSASSFQFVPNTGFQWSITSESGGTGAANGLQGFFSGGPWSYGAITSISGLYTANVSPTSATLTINDGAGHLATANVAWDQVATYGSAGYLNMSAVVNLSGMSYSGANVDLLNFFSSSAGILTLSFQFNPAMTLSQLTAGSGPYITSFSGSLTSVPEPGVLGICALGFAFLGRRIFKR